ncbi:N-acetylmuramoyl-L-alanine amidase [Longirhabdus pacifica]|uniref:N-acetylmuramoyl-L-alanine amidase n=1 Tax=Longirhabdus pacifica TaxID=2305227 RepID=UPI0010091CD5|nr:N-acetylmuramoyl-L-alanine amidase [Longirhabdus pacifica]
MNIKRKILAKGHRNRPGYVMKPKGVLFHTTNNWNDGAGDEMHGIYMSTTNRVVSWHVTVDKDSATQHIPFNENAWHAGDGTNGEYNRNWIGVEIACEAVDPGDPLDEATYQNAVEVVAQIMNQHGFTSASQLQPHAIVYGKNCPHHTLFDRNQFKSDVLKKVNQVSEKFTDVKKNRWSYEAIQQVAEKGWMIGYPNKKFKPSKAVTREELAAVLYNIWKGEQ